MSAPVIDDDVLADMLNAADAAELEHGTLPLEHALWVLVEEVGEVAQAHGDRRFSDDDLVAELLQVASVALRWATEVRRLQS
jgi:hypothetical protein